MKYIAIMISVIDDEANIEQIVECESYEDGIKKITDNMNSYKEELLNKGLSVNQPNSWNWAKRLVFDENGQHKLLQWMIMKKPVKHRKKNG